MVKVTKAVAEKNRERVVKAAGRVIREKGVPNASVGQIAKEAGLTHGAIYKNYASKEDLAAAAISADFDLIAQLLAAIAEQGGTHKDYIAAYLASSHRDNHSWGCPAGALASEISKSDLQVQEAFLAGCNKVLRRIETFDNGRDAPETRARAIHLVSTLVGAIALARATRALDPNLSDEVLAINAEKLRALYTD